MNIADEQAWAIAARYKHRAAAEEAGFVWGRDDLREGDVVCFHTRGAYYVGRIERVRAVSLSGEYVVAYSTRPRLAVHRATCMGARLGRRSSS